MDKNDPRFKRLLWHSRRGMKELEVMLIPFLQKYFLELTDVEQNAYEDLLESTDADLFVWLREGKEYPPEPELKAIIMKIRDLSQRHNDFESAL